MLVELVTNDLVVASRVEGAAQQAGHRIKTISAHAASSAEDDAVDQPALVIIDLSAPALDVAAVVNRARQKPAPPRIIAFGPHVHEARLAEARADGCDEVVSRGQFFAQIGELLRHNLGAQIPPGDG